VIDAPEDRNLLAPDAHPAVALHGPMFGWRHDGKTGIHIRAEAHWEGRSQKRPVIVRLEHAREYGPGWSHPVAGYYFGEIPMFRSNPYWRLQLFPPVAGSYFRRTETLDELVVRAPDLKDSLQHVWRGPTAVDLFVIRDLAAVKKATWPTASMPNGAEGIPSPVLTSRCSLSNSPSAS
jgi:hypothetical protein